MNDKRQEILFKDDGIFPNNPTIPLVLYPGAFGKSPSAEAIEERAGARGWPPAWRYGIYPYHHYHSTAHEFLGCFRGAGKILFGGDTGRVIEVRPGDAVMIPAGVAHKCLDEEGLMMVGAYPLGQRPDMNYGRPGERPGTDENIRALGLPATDPMSGRIQG